MSQVPAIEVIDGAMVLGDRILWKDLNFQIEPGEFVAVLGPNGTGKSTLLKALLGLIPFSQGKAYINGQEVKPGDNGQVGYIPQQQLFAPDAPVRAVDFVRMGIDGTRWGIPLPSPKLFRRSLELLQSVGAADLARKPVGTLSGGEQQRVRVAQAVASHPSVLLCDEPLLSLDLNHQMVVSALINEQRVKTDAAVMFVTHEVNPILPYVDKVLYLVDGRYLMGTPEEVLTSATLSKLYGSPVKVFHIDGQILVHGETGSRCEHAQVPVELMYK